MTAPIAVTTPASVTVSSGVAISAKSTSTTAGDHVGVFNLAADGGANNAALNIVSANAAFSACEVSGHESSHGTLKISHVNPGPGPGSDENAAALSIDLVEISLLGFSYRTVCRHRTGIGHDISDLDLRFSHTHGRFCSYR